MNIGAALAEGSARLRSAGIASDGLDAALLLADLLGLDRPGLLARRDRELSAVEFAAFRDRLSRRADGDCVAYILGRKEFYGLDFIVTPDVLVPRPDSETIVGIALDWLERRFPSAADTARGRPGAALRPPRIADVCAGSGCLGIAVAAARPDIALTLIDLSGPALAVAAANARRLLPSGRQPNLVQADLFSGTGGPYDLIIANPPYIPSAAIAGLAPEVRREPRLALDGGPDGLDLIRRLIRESWTVLDANGRLLIESGSEQVASVEALLTRSGYAAVVRYRGLDGRERAAGGTKLG